MSGDRDQSRKHGSHSLAAGRGAWTLPTVSVATVLGKLVLAFHCVVLGGR